MLHFALVLFLLCISAYAVAAFSVANLPRKSGHNYQRKCSRG